jgi:hypothetical protein
MQFPSGCKKGGLYHVGESFNKKRGEKGRKRGEKEGRERKKEKERKRNERLNIDKIISLAT